MKVYCVQPDLAWHDMHANLKACATLIRAADPPAGSLVVLPETFASGYTNDVAAASDSPRGWAADWLRLFAHNTGCTFVAGLVTIGPDGRGRNVAVVASPDGEVGRYTKRHALPVGGEADHYTPGACPMAFDHAGVRIALGVCYDLRFPEDFRQNAGAEVFVVIANWPAARQHHWHALLRARAIENQAFVVGVNRVGRDPNVEYAGGSVVYDYDGQTLLDMGDAEGAAAASLDIDALRAYRRRLPFLADLLSASQNRK